MKSALFRVLIPLMVVMTLLVVAGCGTAQTSPAAPEQATPSTSPQQAPASPIKLTVWHYWDGNNGDVFATLVDEYNAAHPEVVIENVYLPWGDLLPNLQTAASSGEVPSFAIADMTWMPTLAASGALVELDTYIEASGVDLDDFYPALLGIDRYNGHYLALPVSTNNLELFYNKALFTAAGLDPNKPPATWDELKAAAETCADPDQGVIGMELYTEAANEGLTWQFQVYLWQAGAEFLNEDYSAAAFNSPAGARALQYWVDLVNEGGSALAQWGQFEQSKACMRVDGSWMVGGWAKDLTFDFGTARVPSPADGEPATNMGGEHMFIFETTPQEQQAAWNFIQWFTSPEVQIRWDEGTAFMPIRDAVATHPDYISWIQTNQPQLLPFVESQQYAHARPSVTDYQELSDRFSAQIQKALYGEVTVQEALAAAEKDVNAVLSQ
jgi:multiple sugar transport system substrate-binding protein